MLILNREAVRKSLSHAQCVEEMDATMRLVSKRDVEMPLRQFMAVPGTAGKQGLMPGYIGARSDQEPASFGVKIVSKFPRAADSPYSSHVGAVMIFNADEGIPVALLDGAELTAIRTSAATALATRTLARPDADTLTLIGCGEEAHHHIHAIAAVKDLKKIILWNRSPERASSLASEHPLANDIPFEIEPDLEKAVTEAEILCTLTSATEPFVKGEWLSPGVHVNLVGAAVRTSAEADTQVVARSRFYIDYLPSALAQAGELLNAIEEGTVNEDHIAGEIGAVLDGEAPARQTPEDITVYKSLGVAAQDLAAGYRAFQCAQDGSIGAFVEWQ